MEIFNYSESQSKKNGVYYIKQLILSCLWGILVIPIAILISIKSLSFNLSVIIIMAWLIILILMIKRGRMLIRAARSLIIKYENKLYYFVIGVNNSGISIPSSLPSAVLGENFVQVENMYNNSLSAIENAKNEKLVKAYFEKYINKEYKYTFNQFLYGKTMTGYEILDTSCFDTFKKIYRVKCIKDHKSKKTISIPNCYKFFKN